MTDRRFIGIKRRYGFIIFTFILCSLFLWPILLNYSSAAASDITVEDVHVEGLHSIDDEEIIYLIGIEKGIVVGPESIRRGIKRAFLKGIFQDISIETDDAREELLIVRVREKDIVAEVEIEGVERLSRKIIEESLDLKRGDPVRYEQLEAIKKKVIETIKKKGYPEANMLIKAEETRKPHRITIVVEVNEGSPVIVRKIEVSGLPYEEIKSLMKTRPGRVYDSVLLEKDIDRLREHFKRMGYLKPRVGPYSFEGGTLYLTVEPGRWLEIEIKGNEIIKSKKLLPLMPFFESGDVSDGQIDEAVSEMLALYHERGYAFTKIAPIIREEDNKIFLSFYIDEGNKINVDNIEFSGTTVSPNRLKEIMSIKEGSIYNPDTLPSDVEAVKEFFIAIGYVDVSVGDPEIEIEDRQASINMRIVQGNRVVLSEIAIEGLTSLPDEMLHDAMGIKKGDPYNEIDISDARRKLLSIYKDSGYLNAGVDVTRVLEEDGAHVIFKVSEGKKLYFGKTIVTGNRSVKIKAIKREFQHMEGQPFDSSLLSKTRQGLYRLNLFSSVEINTLEEEEEKVDVVVDIKESKAGTIEFGFGYGQYEQYRGFLDIGYRNLFGMNRSASVRTEQSSLASRYLINYREPRLFGWKVESRTFFLIEKRKEKNIDTGEIRYQIERKTASTGIEREITKNTKVGLYYEYSIVDTEVEDPAVTLSREDVGTLAIGSLSPSVIYDSRDNPFDPQRGIFAGITMKAASKSLLSETDFVKYTVHGSGYLRLTRRLVAALSIRGGAAGAGGNTDELPLVERFFLGGRNTVRGFNQDEIGSPTGGNAFLLGNFELRTKITKGWRIVAFLDAGNVWLKTEDVTPGVLRYTAGGGIQYNTPVGPIRLDYGYKLDKEPEETNSEFHFSIGHAF
jgi:outer membrane protein insertion porin family